jgi:4-amino-4-deoxy-L-arabinose transferase-like glycosyltransferase
MESIPTDSSSRLRQWQPAILGAILLVALILRAVSIGWELPYTVHPDEPSAANTALEMMRAGDWNPRFFEKPSLYYYMLRGVFELQLRAGIAAGHYTGIADLPTTTDRYLTTPGLFIWGRWLSVLLGTLTVAALYAMGRRWSAGVGLAAAALLAVAPFHIRHSQYITVDAATTLMTLLGLWAAIRLLDRRDWRAYALAGLLAGLAASTKYNSGALALAIGVAHMFAWRGDALRRWRLLATAAIASLLGFFAGTPYALLTPEAFIEGIQRQQEVYGAAGAGRWPLAMYAATIWNDIAQPLPALAAIAGIGIAVVQRDRAIAVLLLFALSQALFFLAQDRHFARNLLVITPIIALLAAIAAATAARALAQWQARTTMAKLRLWSIGALVTGIIAAGPLLRAIEQAQFYAAPYSMVRADAYLTERLPHGALVAVEFNPVAVADRPFITPVEHAAEHSADWYRARGFRYVVIHSEDRTAATLREEAVGRVIFPGDKDGAPGPRLELLDLGLDAAELAIVRRSAEFGDRLELLGYVQGAGEIRARFTPLDPNGMTVAPGQALQLNLYWRAMQELDADYAIFLHLLNERGERVAQRDTVIRAADYPTSRWRPGEIALDIADMPLPALPAGEYTLLLGVYRMDTFERLPTDRSPDGAVPLTRIRVEAR